MNTTLTLRLTKNEVTTLVELLSLGSLVAEHNHNPSFDAKLNAVNELEDKIFEHLLCEGHHDMIEFSEDEQAHTVTTQFQQSSWFMECYNEFRQEAFWEELVIRLADRDLARRIGQEKWEAMSEEDRRAQTVDIERTYWSEVEVNGVDHFHLIHPTGLG
jgi:hypothetical protein